MKAGGMFNHSGALRVLYYTILIENLYLICRTLNAIVETIQEETGGGLISHVIITATLPLKGSRLQVKTKVRSIKDACATHVNVCADMTLNSVLKHPITPQQPHPLTPPAPATDLPGLISV